MSSFWGIVVYIRNIILLGLPTKNNTTQLGGLPRMGGALSETPGHESGLAEGIIPGVEGL